MKKPISTIAAIMLASAFFSGCAGLGNRLAQGRVPEGAPDLEAVLEDLADNDARIDNFRAAARFTLESPEVEGTQRFRSGSYMAYRRPDALRVVGRLRTGNIAFRLTGVGEEFLVEFPMERDPEARYYYQFGGETFESVPFSVSPADVAQELFFPEEWASLGPKDARIIGYDQGVVTMTVGPRRHPRRFLDLGQLEDGSWVVLRSELLDKQGNILALTKRDVYHEVDGYRFPTTVEVRFPGEQALISFELKNIRVNTDLVTDSTFTFNWRPTHATPPDGPDASGNR
jgi:hypothetical protein